ncbi:SsgA family sporulation/cell division regulator [Kitasatospora camelliae]|uniref:SsgA family sporulation/cell division regulator n=1 Tax=Kitasatospora camelliae TaxID=3156397 RepID=A0AAU8K3H6_9ACTN
MPDALTCPLAVHVLNSPYPDLPLPAELRFDPDHPYEVCLAFPAPDPVAEEDDRSWYFGRDLLVEGCEAPAGQGDVQVAPADEGRTVISLSGVDGTALICASTPRIEVFLRRSLALVPAGSEAGHLDLDTLLDRLLEAG